jgi:hypothetical protein
MSFSCFGKTLLFYLFVFTDLELHGGKASWVYNLLTSVFSNKIKTKLKEKINKMLTKKCNQFETKINFAASKILSIFSDKEKKV